MKGNGAFRALLGVVASATVVACGSPTSPSASSAAPSQLAANATPTADPRVPAIIDAYKASTQAFVHAAQTSNPVDPLLAATMTGDEYVSVTQNLTRDAGQGIVGRGDLQVRSPHVVSVAGATAVIHDCRWDTLRLTFLKTGQPVSTPQGAGQDEAVKATLTFTSGTWKLSTSDVSAGSCPVGY